MSRSGEEIVVGGAGKTSVVSKVGRRIMDGAGRWRINGLGGIW